MNTRDTGLFGELLAALDGERVFTRTEHDRLMKLGLEDRIAAGASWPLLKVDTCDMLPWGGTRLELRPPRGAVLHDGISVGEPVEVRARGEVYAGSVRGTDSRYAEVRLRDDVELDGEVEVTKRFDPTSFERYAKALRIGETLDKPLVDALLGLAEDAGEPMDHPAFASLNASQARAAATALGCEHLALIHGPPGTGKTHTIAALAKALVDEGEAPLALADSNAAVDHLAVRLAGAGLTVLRLGLPARIGSAAASYSLEETVARGPYGQALTTLERELAKLRSAGEFRTWRQLRRELRDLRDTATDHALSSAQAVCCTLGSLPRFSERLAGRRTAIVDEATQAIEPAVWTVVPLVERLVLVGDPEQLGPVVMQPGNALAVSLFERLVGEGRGAARLDVQHRMHQDIQSLVVQVYGDTYEAHPSVAGHLLCELPGVAETPLTTAPVHLIDTTGSGFEDARDPVTCSTYNDGEVRLVELVVAQLRDAGVRAEDIGVIAPYSAQVQRLSQLDVEVATVNAFQGREKEAIVCSFVRSNPDGELGFVADRRRLTVAITRARRCLVCIGDLGTLSAHPMFDDLGERAAALDAVVSVWSPPWDVVLS
ncbi:MAG: hypothetical protein EP330_19520 [Deltaproteobacteria bacterium]|nr:MAG: hypothetical protein EP330_19520 [Deltaproteobacteria bacterium]